MQIVTASRTLVASVAFLILCSFAFSQILTIVREYLTTTN